MKYCDVLLILRVFVKVWVLRLTADRVAHLPVHLLDVIVPGPDSDLLGGVTLSAAGGGENMMPG